MCPHRLLSIALAVLLGLGANACEKKPAPDDAGDDPVPAVETAWIEIRVVYPGASPAEVEAGVLMALEEAVRELPQVERIWSEAREGEAIVRVYLDAAVLTSLPLERVREAVDAITTFPADAEQPSIQPRTGLAAPTGFWIPSEDRDALPPLDGLPRRAVAEVLAQSAETFEADGHAVVPCVGERRVEVVADPGALAAYGLTAHDVASAITSAALDDDDAFVVAVRTRPPDALVPDLDGLGAIPLGEREVALRLGDVASIGETFSDARCACARGGEQMPCLLTWSETLPPHFVALSGARLVAGAAKGAAEGADTVTRAVADDADRVAIALDALPSDLWVAEPGPSPSARAPLMLAVAGDVPESFDLLPLDSPRSTVALRLRDSAEALGITEDALARAVRGAVFGNQASFGGAAVTVRSGPVRAADDLGEIGAVSVPLPTGGSAPLNQLAELSLETSAGTIYRLDRKRVAVFRVDAAESAALRAQLDGALESAWWLIAR